MSNRLKMVEHQAIIGLWRLKWSYRRIAAELNIDRETVARHVKSFDASADVALSAVDPPGVGPPGVGPPESNAAISITGSTLAPGSSAAVAPGGRRCEVAQPVGSVDGAGSCNDPNAAIVMTGSTGLTMGGTVEVAADGAASVGSEARLPPEASPGRQSLCEPLRAAIVAGLELGLTAQRIWQDLQGRARVRRRLPVRPAVRAAGSAGVLRRCRSGGWSASRAPRARSTSARARRSSGPTAGGARPHLFRIVLSHSRKGYSEVVPRQTHRAVPALHRERLLVLRRRAPDAGARQPQGRRPAGRLVRPRAEPQDRRVLRALRHGPAADAPADAAAQGQGRARRGLRPVQRRARAHASPAWPSRTSSCGSGRRPSPTPASTAPRASRWRPAFERGEAGAAAAAGGPLPLLPGGQADGQPRRARGGGQGVLLGPAGVRRPHAVWARWDGHTVRLFDEQLRQIAIHARREPGRFATDAEHIAPEKRGGVERGAAWWLDKARRHRPPRRPVGRVDPAAARHPRRAGGDGAGRASRAATRPVPSSGRAGWRVSHGAYRLRDLRNLLKRSEPAGRAAAVAVRRGAPADPSAGRVRQDDPGSGVRPTPRWRRQR